MKQSASRCFSMCMGHGDSFHIYFLEDASHKYGVFFHGTKCLSMTSDLVDGNGQLNLFCRLGQVPILARTVLLC